MRTSSAIVIGAATVAALDVAATIEAFRSDRPAIGVVTLLAAMGALTVAAMARRPTIELRGDLAEWTARTAAATGEAETDLVNRAVVRHRAELDGDWGPDG